MNPREIEVHIEELVLHGFQPYDRWPIAAALEGELRGLLAECGLPRGWLQSQKEIVASPLCPGNLTRRAQGRKIALAIYGAETK